MYAGPTELVGLARTSIVGGGPGDGLGDVGHIDGLEAGLAAADERQDGTDRSQRSEAIEKPVLRAEHDGWANDCGAPEDIAHSLFALGLAAGVVGRRGAVCADGRHLNQAVQLGGPSRPRDGRRAVNLHGAEGLGGGPIEDSHQVDRRLGPFEGAGDRGVITDISLDDLYLADVAQHAQPIAAARIADRNADPRAAARQGAHHLGPDKAGSPENGDQPIHGVS